MRLILDSLASNPAWPALRNGRLFAADGNACFNRPSPRLVEHKEATVYSLKWARSFGS